MSALATTEELMLWFEDAQDALDLLDGQLATTWLRALAAQPDRPFAGHRRTWYIEEAERLQKERVRDGFPQSDAEAEAWRERQDRREAQIMDLMDRHTEALVEAAQYARREGIWSANGTPTPRKAPKPARAKRLSAVDLALLNEPRQAA